MLRDLSRDMCVIDKQLFFISNKVVEVSVASLITSLLEEMKKVSRLFLSESKPLYASCSKFLQNSGFYQKETVYVNCPRIAISINSNLLYPFYSSSVIN